MEWLEIKLYTKTDALDIVTGFLVTNGIRGLMIEDAEDFDEFLSEKSINWDYIDDDLMKLKTAPTAVIFYVPDNMQGLEMIKSVKSQIPTLIAQNPEIEFGSMEFENKTILEEDWEVAWKKYYRPVRVGEKIIICPCWEELEVAADEVKVLLDPGMAFGTGTHETTRLCLTLLEENVTKDTELLDVGTGSGILAITALLLGAKTAVGVDIDELAVKIAGENAKLNSVHDKIELHCSDLTQKISGTYDVICANIVADVIIRLCPDIKNFMREDTLLLLSGIIDDRYDDILASLEENSLEVVKKISENDWVALTCKLK